MENLDQLISCSGDLNHHLVAFAQGDDFREVLSQALEDRFGEVITGDEAEIANFFDYFILQHVLHDGRTVLDHYMVVNGQVSVGYERCTGIRTGWIISSQIAWQRNMSALARFRASVHLQTFVCVLMDIG